MTKNHEVQFGMHFHQPIRNPKKKKSLRKFWLPNTCVTPEIGCIGVLFVFVLVPLTICGGTRRGELPISGVRGGGCLILSG